MYYKAYTLWQIIEAKNLIQEASIKSFLNILVHTVLLTSVPYNEHLLFFSHLLKKLIG